MPDILMSALRRAIEAPDTYQKIEVRLKHKSGHWVWTEITGHAMRNGRGETEIHTVSRDISERRATEEALRQAEEKYRSIFENAVEGIFQTTPEGRYLDANSSLGAHLTASVRSKSCARLFPTSRASFIPNPTGAPNLWP